MRAVLAGVAVLALMVTACSSSSNGKPTISIGTSVSSTGLSASGAGSSGSVSPSPAAPDLSSQLLAVTDLPTGWSIDNSSSDDDTDAPPCLKSLKSAFHTSTDAERDFVQGTDVPAFDQEIGWFGSDSQAATTFQTGAAILNDCKDVSFTSDGTSFTGTIGQLSFPTFGDRSEAWALTLSAEGQTVVIDAVVLNKGAELEALLYLDYDSVDVDEFTDFVTKAVARMP
jgi:hypothetical protein